MRRMVFVAVLLAVAFAISPGWADHKLGHDEAAPAGIEALEESIKALEERVRDLEQVLFGATPTSEFGLVIGLLTPGIESRLRALESGERNLLWLVRQKTAAQ